MKGKNLLILVVVAIVLAGLAVVSSRSRSTALPDVIGKRVLPDLPVNDVEKMVVSAPGGTITLAKENDAWITPSKFNYPAEFQKIKDVLLQLSEMKIGQVMRLTAGQKAAMGMGAPASGAPANAGTVLELFGAKDRKLATVLLGASRQRKAPANSGFEGMGGYADGRYLSPDGGKTVYLVTDSLEDVSTKAKDWLDTELLNVNGSDISEITVTVPGKPDLRLVRKDPTKLDVDGMAADEEADGSKLYGIESALSYLRFSDVADPALTDAQTGMDKPTVFKLTTHKGQVYTATIGSVATNSMERYVRLDVALKPAATNQPAATEAGNTNAVAAAAKVAEERKKLDEEMQALNGKVGTWTYLIESYKTDAMLTTRESLLKKKEPPKVEESPAAVTTEATPAAPKPEAPTPAADKADEKASPPPAAKP